MTEKEIELDPLAPKVEEALLKSKMSATAFGYVHFGDPAFISKMRKGRMYRTKMANKIERVYWEVTNRDR